MQLQLHISGVMLKKQSHGNSLCNGDVNFLHIQYIRLDISTKNTVKNAKKCYIASISSNAIKKMHGQNSFYIRILKQISVMKVDWCDNSE